MKLSYSLLFAAFSALSLAAPVEDATPSANTTVSGMSFETAGASSDSLNLPAEAVIGAVDFGSDITPVIVEDTDGVPNKMLFLNSTVMDQIHGGEAIGNSKREADAGWHWLYLRPGQPMFKRDANADADADARWHWLYLRPGQPMFKRDANADADADADAGWHWLYLRPGQPMFKRDANADADADADADARWHWLYLRPGQPMFKRDANADADADARWHWLYLRPGQPMF